MSFNLETTSSILLRGTHRLAEKVNQEFTNLEYSSNVDIKGDLSQYTDALYYLTEALQYRLERNLFDDTTTSLTEELERRLGTYIDTSSLDNNYLPPKGTMVVPVGVFSNTFLLLTDTPDSYLGEAGAAVAVNSNATGLEFIPFPTPTPYTVNNGLTASTSNNFQWGGSLIQSVNIDGALAGSFPYGINFTNLNFFQVSSNGSSTQSPGALSVNSAGAFMRSTFNSRTAEVGVIYDGTYTYGKLQGSGSIGLYTKNAHNVGHNIGVGVIINDEEDFVGLYYPTSGSTSGGSTWFSGGVWAGDYSVAGIHYAGDRWIPHVGYVKSLININLPDGVITGLGMSISGSNVLVTLGSWRISGVAYSTTTTTTLAIDAQNATLSRYDSVYADNANTLHIVSGTLSATPVHPDIPNGTIRVGDILITPTTVTTAPLPAGGYVTTTTNQPAIYGNKEFKDSVVVDTAFQSLGTTIIGAGGDWYGSLQIRSDGAVGQGLIRLSNQYNSGYDCSIYQTNINGPSDLVLSNGGYAGSLRARGNDLYDSSGNIFLKSGGGSTVAWSSITSKPTTLSGFGITDAVAATGGTITGALSITTATGVNPLTITAFNGGYLGVTSTGLSFKGVSTDFTNNGSTTLLHLGDGTQSALSNMPRLQVTTTPSAANDVVRLTDLSAYLKLVGGSLTGDVQQSVSPVNSSSLITKGYVDTAIANSSIYFAAGTLLGAGTSGSPYSPNATNGLTVSSGNGIQLGGSLTANSTITLGSFSLTFSGTPIVTGIKTASGTGTNVFLDNGTLVATSTFGGGASLSTPNTWTALQTFGTNISIGGVTTTGATGTGKVVFDGTPTLVTPILGVATATSINKVTITAPTTSATLTLVTGSTLQTTGAFTLNLTTTATTTPTFTAGTGTVPYIGSTNTWSALQTFGNNISIGGVTSTGATGTGNNVFSASPTLTGTLTLDGGVGYTVKGSTSGVISFQTQTIAGTYNWNWPTSAGSSGSILTSSGGAGAAMTWTPVTGSQNIVMSQSPTFSVGFSISGTSSGVVTIQPQAVAGTYNWNLPTSAGTSGYLLTSGGGVSTAMSWTDPTTIAASTSTKWATARNLAGNSVDGSANVAFANKFIVQGTTDAGLSAAQFLGALGTGLVKNTTTTGVLSIAVAGTDYAGLASLNTFTALQTFSISDTSGTGVTGIGHTISNTINQTSTAAFTDLLVNRIQTAAGSGAQLLLDLQVGGTSKFKVSNAGSITSVAGINLSGSASIGVFSQSATSFDGIFMQNFATSTSGQPNITSPRINLQTNVWNTSGTPANNVANVIQEIQAVSSGTPGFNYVWSGRINASGTGAFTPLMSLGSDGTLSVLAGLLKLKTYTVSTLPAASSYTGAMAYVSDATSPTWGATLVGGGAVGCLAVSNGTNWTAR